MKILKESLWSQIFLANYYLEEFYKKENLEEYGLTIQDYFFLLVLEVYGNLSSNEFFKYFPIEKEKVQIRVNFLIEKGLINKEYERKTPFLNLTSSAKKVVNDISNVSLNKLKESYGKEELISLFYSLYDFNRKMKDFLELGLEVNL